MKEKLHQNYINDILADNVIEITLSFTGESLNKYEVTDKLKLEPTKAWNNNEILSINSLGKSKIATFGKWIFKFISAEEDLNKSLQNFFKELPQNFQIWQELSIKHTACIEITTYQKQWQNSYDLSLKSLKLITDRYLHLSFECYNVLQEEF